MKSMDFCHYTVMDLPWIEMHKMSFNGLHFKVVYGDYLLGLWREGSYKWITFEFFSHRPRPAISNQKIPVRKLGCVFCSIFWFIITLITIKINWVIYDLIPLSDHSDHSYTFLHRPSCRQHARQHYNRTR